MDRMDRIDKIEELIPHIVRLKHSVCKLGDFINSSENISGYLYCFLDKRFGSTNNPIHIAEHLILNCNKSLSKRRLHRVYYK